MLSLDVLYYALAGGFLVLVGFWAYVLYQLGLALKSLRITIERLAKIVEEVESLGASLRWGFWGLLDWLLKKARKGGEGNGRKP
ncbi:MAG TPA: DUF948 domain-containing protein [Clostridia bacterium]|nr:DUF948 domain-containing protein [Clostridia bacterium]